ncbi:hypothetical protein LCGC14_0757210 [marine sediment metagenome]|uniref:N-acetyltransferase domain-containing protein n=1 Tax=marine sediment metagenome TaxID=412755 RepID=A0A0F9SMG7_9ZZZZ|nr:MAG: hypothetical protein Lokiarch_17560 [Candidatus Lokiarchaeum sp. GC14_75]HEC39348.1 GNAT family N-acetyltransferase [bacterium]
MLRQNPKLNKLLRKANPQSLFFQSSIEEIEIFFYKDSKKFIEDDYCQLYYLYDKKKAVVIGYFTLSMGSVRHEKDIPIKKYVERIPCALIGRLGVHKLYEREGWGADLVKEAISLIIKLSQKIGCRCVYVDSLTTLNAILFYLNLGFNFIDKNLGQKILRLLKDQKKPQKNSIMMYFDLKKIRK